MVFTRPYIAFLALASGSSLCQTVAPAGPAAWYLVEVKSDPGNRSRHLPQIYEGRDLGGYERHTLRAGYYKLEVVANNLVPSGIVPGPQYTSELTFSQPPAVIQPGQTFELQIQGRNSVTRPGHLSGASGRWGGPQGLEDQMRVCSIPITHDPRSFTAQCYTSVRFTAGSLPDEFSLVQVAQGQGVAGEFRYCKNRACAGQTPAQGAAPAAGPFRVEINACQGDVAETRRRGRLNVWARAVDLPGDDERSTFEWIVDGSPTDRKAASAFFDGLADGDHVITAVAIYRGQRSQSATVTCRVAGGGIVGIQPPAAAAPPPVTGPPAAAAPPPVTGPPAAAAPPPVAGPPAAAAPPPVTGPPAAAAPPPAVTIQTAGGRREIDPLVGTFAIQLTPGDPRADLAGRCNMLMATFVAVAMSVDANATRWGSSALADMLFQIRVICGKKLGLNRVRSGAVADGDGPLAAEVTVDLRDGAVHFDTPLEETTLTVRTPAGSVVSSGRASFDAGFDPRTLKLLVVSQRGAVELRPAAPGAGSMRLRPGEALELASTGQQPAAAGSQCGLGRVWQDLDPYWKGSWTRRGESNIFDAVWTGGNLRVDAQMVISIEGTRVSMTRSGYNRLSDGEIADYEGTLGPDGVTVSGSYRWRNPKLGGGRWQATIGCTNPR